MSRIAVEVMPEETRMVCVKDGKLTDIYYERTADEHVVNRIYKGVVRNILPGMEAAFVDIGLERNAYLKLLKPIGKHYGGPLSVGQTLMVQVVKEAMEGKAARVTGEVSLAGRFAVLLPNTAELRISKKITDNDSREYLKSVAREYMTDGHGFILRTAARDATMAELAADMEYLRQTFVHVERRFKLAKGGAELYRDVDFWLRLVRDYGAKDIKEILVDEDSGYQRLQELYKHSETAPAITLYKKGSLFSHLGVEEELDGIVNSTVPLASGGDLRIDRTEALTIIDVNSKSYTGRNESIGDTAFAVNKEAAFEVCRQLRLRDIGGIIIVDFIDMDKEEKKKQLLDILRQEARQDRVRTVVCGITSLGLVEITRKREKQGTQELLTDTCNSCGGAGYLLSAETIYLQIIRRLTQLKKSGRLKGDILIQTHPEVSAFFSKKVVEELSGRFSRTIVVESSKENAREAYALLSL